MNKFNYNLNFCGQKNHLMLKLNRLGGKMLATIGLVIDIIVVAVLVIFGIIGFCKGFFKSILSFFSWAVCLIVAVFSAKYVANWLNHIYDFSGLIGRGISNELLSYNEYFSTLATNYNVDNIPSGMGLLGQLTKVVFSSNIEGNFAENETIASVVGASLGHVVMVIITAILIFVILKIVLFIINKIVDKITKTKVIGVLNKIFGLVFGVLKAGFIVVVFNVVLVFLTLIPAVNNTITPLVQENTYVERVIYNQTDRFVEKYIINEGAMQNWLSSLWENKE